MKNIVFSCVVAGGLAMSVPTAAVAQDYPERPVTLVVPFPPAGTIDRLAREFADHLSKEWSQSVVVENRGGGNGIVGAEVVRHAKADGYTILIGSSSTHSVGPASDPNIQYDPLKDFTPISYLGDTPQVITTGPQFEANDLPTIIAQAKENPGSVTYGSVGTATYLAAALLEDASGAKLRRVNYKQFGQVLIDIVNGDVNLGVSSLSIAIGNIRQGQLVPVAVTGAERSPLLPNVPTVAETYPGVEASIWFGLYGPAGLPDQIAEEISGEFAAFAEAPEVKERWAREGFELRPRSADDFAKFNEDDLEKWVGLARKIGMEEAE